MCLDNYNTMQKPLIIISGTPGSGKSTLAIWLAKKLKGMRVDIHDYYTELSTKYDKKKQCYDIDMKKFEKLVKEKIKGVSKNQEYRALIIDSHITHLLPKKLVDLCIVTTCSNLKKLEQRLQERKYSKQKIRENLDVEIFQICLHEAKEKGHQVLVVDTAKRVNKTQIASFISGYLK